MQRLFRRRSAHEESEEPPVARERVLPVELVIGLGNPGSRYAANRHNVGYWTVNRLGRRLGIALTKHTGLATTGEGTYNGRRLILAKPRTFMNNSGDAVRELVRRYQLEPAQALIVYDDLDLPVAKVRLRARGSHGGNNGIRSIITRLGSQDFPRIKIGIGRPVVGGEPSHDPDHVAAWVLADPPPEERDRLDRAVQVALDAIIAILDDGVEAAMNRFNRGDPAPPPAGN